METYENKMGIFWIENNKEEEFQGKININNNDLTLTLVNKTFKNIKNNHILINGLIEGTSLSFILLKYPLNEQMSQDKEKHIIVRTYLLEQVFINTHYENKSNILFKNITFKINNINSVINLNKINLNLDGDIEKYPIKTKQSEDYIVPFKDYILKIENKQGLDSKSKGNGKNITIKEEIYITIEYNEKQNLNKIIKDMVQIRNLFRLLTEKSEIIEIIENKETEAPVHIILPEILSKTNEKSGYNPIKLNKQNIEAVFTNWLTNYEKLTSVYDLFFSIDEDNVNPATLLLTYSQIIESYHRQFYEGTYVDRKEFKQINKNIRENIKEVIETTPIKLKNEEQRKSFKEKLINSVNYSYEYSLKDRLIELFNDLNKYNYFKEILKRHSTKNYEYAIEELSKIIKDNRNYYTHYDEKNKKFFKGFELLELNDTLKNIIKLIFLKELGFTVEEIDSYTKNNPQFNFNIYIK